MALIESRIESAVRFVFESNLRMIIIQRHSCRLGGWAEGCQYTVPCSWACNSERTTQLNPHYSSRLLAIFFPKFVCFFPLWCPYIFVIFHFPHRISLELNEKSFSHWLHLNYRVKQLKMPRQWQHGEELNQSIYRRASLPQSMIGWEIAVSAHAQLHMRS